MAIGNAIEKHGFVYVYDENGVHLTTLGGGGDLPGDGLKSFTASVVNIQRNCFIYSYDQQGNHVGTIGA